MRSLTLTILSIFVLPAILLIVAPALAGPYLNSAHGNDSYGVDRTSTPHYPVGQCGHCHEQHASIGGEEPAPAGGNPSIFLAFKDPFPDDPYAMQTESFCLECHTNVGSLQNGGGIQNYSYSYNFGGNRAAGTYDTSIKEQFDHLSGPGSSHTIYDMKNLRGVPLKDMYGNNFTIPADMNPCRICHDPHLVQRNYPVTIDGGLLRTAVTRKFGGLWGDSANERMNSYAPTHNYYSPLYSGSTTTYEPAGNAVSDGANVPSYLMLCTDCHNQYNNITSNNPKLPGSPRLLKKFNWLQEYHGAEDAVHNTHLLDPYPGSGSSYHIVLNCTDCHEPHGSTTNVFLWRTSINGKDVYAPDESQDSYVAFCSACHDENFFFHLGGSCYGFPCHDHGADAF